MQRRSFLVGTGVVLVGCKALKFRPDTPEPLDDHERATIAAIADTFLPGDDGTPGAHEANALATIVDPAYGLLPYLSELVADLDQWCVATRLTAFTGLSARDRERVLEQRMGMHGKHIQSLYRPAYEGTLALAKLALFGGLHNTLGPSYAAFPGASRGYAAGSAAGAWASRDRPWQLVRGRSSAIQIDGAGATSSVRVSAFASAETVQATLRVHAPGGKHHDLQLRGRGDILVDDVPLPLVGGPAAGAWRLEVTAVAAGTARVELWSLRLRTNLDDEAGRA